jgi:mannose-6-phosphate isomerase-like protein (cupin superfamily)
VRGLSILKRVQSRIFGDLHPRTLIATGLCCLTALGWGMREIAFARAKAETLKSRTIDVSEVTMKEADFNGSRAGENGVYIAGDTPASSNFVTGRFTIDPGKTPHKPHTHVEEEIMIVEKGTGEIFCDGKTTKVGPGSVMFTTPHAPHGIENTGKDPLTFYYVKWAPGRRANASN